MNNWLLFAITWGLPFVVYIVLQAAALLKLSSRRRLAALVPVLPMLGVAIATARAYQAQSNLWPILLVLVSPVACLYLGVLLMQERALRGR